MAKLWAKGEDKIEHGPLLSRSAARKIVIHTSSRRLVLTLLNCLRKWVKVTAARDKTNNLLSVNTFDWNEYLKLSLPEVNELRVMLLRYG